MVRIMLFVALVACVPGAWAAELRVSSFNIRWYGKAGEGRDADLKEWVGRTLSSSDVIAFEEIVDVERLKHEVLGAGFRCVSYSHPEPEHQHVVLCAQARFRLEPETGAAGFVFPEVALEKYRPAVAAVLRDQWGKKLAHLIAVHLKAGVEFSDYRREQARRIVKRIQRTFKDNLPTIVVGDLNTHRSAEHDDEAELGGVFSAAKLEQSPHRSRYTFRSSRFAGRFDHVWATKSAVPIGPIEVFGPCNSDDAEAILAYYERISDHCLISVTLDLRPR